MLRGHGAIGRGPRSATELGELLGQAGVGIVSPRGARPRLVGDILGRPVPGEGLLPVLLRLLLVLVLHEVVGASITGGILLLLLLRV